MSRVMYPGYVPIVCGLMKNTPLNPYLSNSGAAYWNWLRQPSSNVSISGLAGSGVPSVWCLSRSRTVTLSKPAAFNALSCASNVAGVMAMSYVSLGSTW